MKRSELEHVIRASGAIADDNELIIIGSQSILGQYPDAPAELLASMETDLYPRNKPELAELVDGSIGEGSFFLVSPKFPSSDQIRNPSRSRCASPKARPSCR